MIKKISFIFLLLIPSSIILAMEEEPRPARLGSELAGKLKSTAEEYTQLRFTFSLFAQQEELRQALEYFAQKSEISKNLSHEIETFITNASILELIPERLMVQFKNIKNHYTTMIIMRNRDFIVKLRDFSDKDKLLAERLSKSSNDEIREIGELKKLHIQNHRVALETERALNLFGSALKPFGQALESFVSEAPKDILGNVVNLLGPGRLTLTITPGFFTTLEPKVLLENLKKTKNILRNYQTSYEKFNVKKIYAENVSRLKQLTRTFEEIIKLKGLPESDKTPIQNLLATGSSYFSLGEEPQLKPLPDTLDEVVWDIKKVEEPVEEIEELPIKEKPIPKKKPARKPKRKKKPTRKPEKPVEMVEPEIPEEVEAEIEEEIEVEEVEPTYPELAKWFNENFKTTDGSSVSFIDNYQIIIADPKNNAQVVLYRKSQDDKKIITPALFYTDRVEQWFTDPQKALEEGSYTAKIKTRKKLDEMAGRHNFAQITDAFIDKEGVSETHIDEKKRKIPVKLLAGELRLRQPDGSVETISGIFSYGKLPKANKYYHRYLHEKEYGAIAQEYYADAKWQVEFPPLT